MDYKIEPKIPIPKKQIEAKYPFKKLKINESFLIDKSEVQAKSNYANFTSNIHSLAKAAGIKISLRKLDNGDIRVWRIE